MFNKNLFKAITYDFFTHPNIWAPHRDDPR
jgi:hypothetical protein